MTALAALAHAFRRWMRLACAMATLLTLAAPAALGPAMAPVLRELGAAQEHVCKCGMPAGKCGCPECERAAHERLAEHVPAAVPVLKRSCDQDAPLLASAGVPAVLTAGAASMLPADAAGWLPLATYGPLPSWDPETLSPPPRSASM